MLMLMFLGVELDGNLCLKWFEVVFVVGVVLFVVGVDLIGVGG